MVTVGKYTIHGSYGNVATIIDLFDFRPGPDLTSSVTQTVFAVFSGLPTIDKDRPSTYGEGLNVRFELIETTENFQDGA